MNIEIMTHKILTCSPNPDPQGDIIPPESVVFDDDIQIFKENPHPKNFVTFAKAEVQADGIYAKFPKPALAKFDGMYLAPEGSVTKMQVVVKDGRKCRLIRRLVLSGIAIVPRHVDPNIQPLRIEDVGSAEGIQTKPKRAKSKGTGNKATGEKRRRVTIKSSAGRSSGTDSSDKPSKKKPSFKRKRS